ncbi:MAG: transposase [Planctomycetes bacterium]|nr:transposase [Planctomycetota bacterium]
MAEEDYRHLLSDLESVIDAYAERFVRAIKETCLDHMIFFGETSLRTAIPEFLGHYHHERNHQGLGHRLIDPQDEVVVPEKSHLRNGEIGALVKSAGIGQCFAPSDHRESQLNHHITGRKNIPPGCSADQPQ